jgi:uncharacterized protein
MVVSGSREGRMALPDLKLSDIPMGGLDLDCTVAPAELMLAPGEGTVKGELTLAVRLSKSGASVDVTGRLDGTVVRQCVRCLSEYDDRLQVPISATYRCRKPIPPAQSAAEPVVKRTAAARARIRTVDVDEEDIYECDGERIALGAMLREEIILAMPMQPLCRPDCLGLCRTCGQNWNEGRCACGVTPSGGKTIDH